jgi:tetratricopeptide (TPR) repeat protein
MLLIVVLVFLILPFQLAFKPHGYHTDRFLPLSPLRSLSLEEVLNGKRKDLATIEYALENMLVCDPAFMTRPNALSKVISVLDTCRAEGLVLLHWWKRLTIEGKTPVNAKAVRSLVAQIHSRAKEDRQALYTLIQVVSALDDSLVVEDTVTVLLLYKILFLLENTDQALEYFLKAARFSPETVERGAIVMISGMYTSLSYTFLKCKRSS